MSKSGQRLHARRIAVALAVLAGAWATGCATPPRGPEIRRDAVRRVGSVEIDPVSRCVIVTGRVNLVTGYVELLVCGEDGKRHESVFVADLNPLDLQTALILLGHRAGDPMARLGEGPPNGTPMILWVAWTDAKGRPRAERGERFLRRLRGERELPDLPWIFTGSTFEEGKYMARAEESWIATYWDPWAVVNIGHEAGSDDEALMIETTRVPPLHAPVTLYLCIP